MLVSKCLSVRQFSTEFGKRVGFIGLGNMGLPMTSNLVKKGFQVKAYDLNPQTLEKCHEIVSTQSDNDRVQGVKPVKTVGETASDVDYIVTSVPATKDVEQLLEGPDGIFKHAKKGTYIVDTSTISPIASKEFAAEAKKKDLIFVDSPMSGGITGAQAGTLTFMVGCEKDHFEAVKHVLLGMGKNVFHCGGPGTGEIAKICNNLILGINMIAISEGLSLGEKLGIDPKILSSIISVSTGRSWCADTYNPRPGVLENVPASRDYNGGFQVSLIRKDLSIALEAGEQANAQLKFGQHAIDYYRDIEKKGYGKKDFGFETQEMETKETTQIQQTEEELEKLKLQNDNYKGDAIQMQGELDIDPNDLDNNPYIYSHTTAVQKFSFVDSRQQFDKKCPPPKYFTDEELLKPLPTDKEEILKGFQETQQGGLVCIDQEAMDKQKGVLIDVLKQLTVNLLKGLTITHISLPVKIFEPRSTLQRVVDLFSFSPIFLTKAAETEDHLERFKLVIANAVSSMYLCCSQNKPFNPILGETLQAHFADGTEVYCEHTSHHPPISNFLVHPKDRKGYQFWGHFEFVGSMSGNSLRAGQKGPNNIKFDDGQHIRYTLLDYKLGGTVMGDRTVEGIGNMFFEDLTNNTRCVIMFNTYKKSGFWRVTETGKKDEFYGLIYKTKEPINAEESFKTYFTKNAADIKDLSKLDSDIEEKLCDISGSWLRHIKIGEEVYWDIEQFKPYRQIPMTTKNQFIAPSDWRFREDLIWLKYKNIPIAHNWKVRMEVQQRQDRRLRQLKSGKSH